MTPRNPIFRPQTASRVPNENQGRQWKLSQNKNGFFGKILFLLRLEHHLKNSHAAPTQKKSMQFGCNSDAIRTSDNSDAIRMDRFGWQVGDLRIFRNEALAQNSDEIRMRVVPQFVLLVTATSTYFLRFENFGNLLSPS